MQTFTDKAAADPRLSMFTLRVLDLLILLAGDRRFVRTTISDLARKLEAHEKTVGRCLKVLEAAGFVVRKRTGTVRGGTLLFLADES